MLPEGRGVSTVRRIEILIDHLEVGGSEIQTLRLAAGLATLGQRVRLTSLTRGGVPLPDEAVARAAGVEVLSGPARSRAANARAALAGVVQRRPDILYAVLARSQTVAALARGIRPGTRLVLSRRFHPQQVQGPRRLVRDAPLLACDGVITNNRACMEDAWVRRLVGRATPVLMVGNQLSADAFDRVAPIPGLPSPVIGCVANLRAVKGHGYLLAAVRQLAPLSPTVLLAGEGPDLDDLTRRAVQQGVRVRFLGRVDDVRAVHAASDIIVQSSLSEGYPNAVLEAMAQGKAIVATDVGQTREIVGDAAWLVPAADAGALGQAIGSLLADPQARSSLGMAARQRALLLGSDPSPQVGAFFERLVAGRALTHGR